MTRPSERWPELWQLFMVLHEDYADDFDSEDAALLDQVESTPTDALQQALEEWHDAFDDVDEDGIEERVSGLNTSYGPAHRFGSHREWAEWVREHLDAELARRG